MSTNTLLIYVQLDNLLIITITHQGIYYSASGTLFAGVQYVAGCAGYSCPWRAKIASKNRCTFLFLLSGIFPNILRLVHAVRAELSSWRRFLSVLDTGEGVCDVPN